MSEEILAPRESGEMLNSANQKFDCEYFFYGENQSPLVYKEGLSSELSDSAPPKIDMGLGYQYFKEDQGEMAANQLYLEKYQNICSSLKSV